jgi:FkbM family methyltransferase
MDAPVRPAVRPLHAWLMRVRPAPIAAALKAVLGIRRVEVEAQGAVFWADPVSQFGQCLLREGVYEPGLTRLVRELLQPGETFLDLGCNEGYFAVQAGRSVGRSGRVIAVEPQTRLHEVIRRNARTNGLDNVELWAVAVARGAGSARLFLSPSTNSGASGLRPPARYPVASDVVRTVTLAGLLDEARVDHADLAKIDIEGAEGDAILGSPEVFARQRIRRLVLELHPAALEARGQSAGAVTAFLEACGYRGEPIHGHLVYAASSGSSAVQTVVRP